MAVDLGTRLVREELVSRVDMERALSHAALRARTLPHALVDLGLLTEDGLSRFFRARLPFGEVGRPTLAEVSPATATLIPREMSEQLGVLAVGRVEDTLSVAMVDPSSGHAIAEVGFFTGCQVMPLVVRPSDLDWARELLYPAASHPGTPSAVSPAAPGAEGVLDLVTRRKQAEAPPAPAKHDALAVTGVMVRVQPPADVDKTTLAVTGVHEIPEARRAPSPAAPATTALAIGTDVDTPTLLARLHRSADRDEVIALAVTVVARSCRRAALFVVKKGVAQGWDAAGDGVVEGAIRNVWIPVSSPSVLRVAATTLAPYVGAIEDTIANGILMAALGRRVDRVGVWPVVVRERPIAILYADGLGTESLARVDEVVHELALAFERIILEEKARR